MKKISTNYRTIIKTLAVMSLLILFINYGCQNNDSDQKPTQLNYSGEEIFRGVFFSQGDLPNQIEALKAEHEKSESAIATNKNVKEFKLDFSNEIVKSINILDPTFFNNFKKQMESKNYYAIQLALSNGNKMIKAAGYKSKYSGYFKLTDKLESKKADFSTKEFQNLDINTPEGIAKYKSLIKYKYDIDLDDENYKIACAPSIGFCIIVVVVAGFTLAYAINYVYNINEYWGGVSGQDKFGNVLIEELATKLGSSHGLLGFS